MEQKQNYLTSPVAILIGAIIIAGAILISNGVIPLKTNYQDNIKGVTATPTPQALPLGEKGPDTTKVKLLSEFDHVRGERSAKILMITYSDLECPFCKRFHETALQVFDNYKGQIAWVYRYFPLSFHKQAQKEAEAAECAAIVGGDKAFWKMVDTIYLETSGNDSLDLSKLPQYAVSSGVDQQDFEKCLTTGKATAKVKSDQQSGIDVGVSGTPTTFLINTQNGKKDVINGALPFDQIKAKIDNLL